jgi:beta-aspartyl-dipeptidase (metallo-type)
MLTLIENGEVYAPEPCGRRSVLLVEGRVGKVGAVDRRAVEALGLELDVIDATGCVVAPALIDPHEHLAGGSGEKGYATQTPEIHAGEILCAGITTVVGCIGVDSMTKTLPALVAKAKGLKQEGLNARVWTGGYNVPPTTLTGSVRDDIMLVEEMVGAGEVAISDERSTEPSPHELARLVNDAHNGGLLSGKAGVTHFHVGSKKSRLQPLRTLIDEYEIPPVWLYPTHVERDEELMREAIDLARLGAFVDVDTVEEDLPKWLRFYLENGGPTEQLTASSDASINSPGTLFEQVRACVLQHGFPFEQVLPLVTSNTARVLKLRDRGTLEAGKSADVLVLRGRSLEIKDVFAGGRRLIRDGRLAFAEKFLAESNRRIRLDGARAGKGQGEDA